MMIHRENRETDRLRATGIEFPSPTNTRCFESVTLIQPQQKGGPLKGLARAHCLNCMDEQEYDLTVPANKEDIINAKGSDALT